MTTVDTSTITTSNWQPKIGSAGAVLLDVQDVDQCIRTILATPKGSDPLRPLFGFDGWNYLDWPVNQARPHLVREIIAALVWEPRIVVDTVQVTVVDESPYHQLAALVSWRWAFDQTDVARYQTFMRLGGMQ